MSKKDVVIAIIGLVVGLGLIALVLAMPTSKGKKSNTSDNTHDTTNVEGHNNSSSDKGGQ